MKFNWRKYTVRPIFKIGRLFGRDNIYNRLDIIDPFFEYGRRKFNRATNWDLCDKYRLKQHANGFKTPETFFTFDAEGNILSGAKPSSGKVVIKYNLSIRSDSVEIINSKDINKKTLSDFAKKALVNDKKDWNDRNVEGLDLSIFYCEAAVEGIVGELKVYVDLKGNNYISWEKNNLELHTKNLEFRALWFNSNLEQEYHPTHNTKDENTLTDQQKILVRKGVEQAKKLIHRVGHFARVDFLVTNDDLYFSEVTPNASGFFYDKYEEQYKQIPYEEKKRFIEFYSNGLKEKRNM